MTQTETNNIHLPIERLDVAAYTIPTSRPESDGPLRWDSTMLVVVEPVAGGMRGLGYTYADTATVSERAAIVEMVEHHEGRESAAIARYWLTRQPDAFQAIRQVGGRLIGFMANLRLEEVTREDTVADPAIGLAMNYADRHTYGFEEKVLPVARERGLGVMAMKVFGGIRGSFPNYSAKTPHPSQMEKELHRDAIRGAPLVAGAGCVATASILALVAIVFLLYVSSGSWLRVGIVKILCDSAHIGLQASGGHGVLGGVRRRGSARNRRRRACARRSLRRGHVRQQPRPAPHPSRTGGRCTASAGSCR